MLETAQTQTLERQIESSLQEWQRIRDHEAETCPGLDAWRDRDSALKLESANYALHQQWALEAQELLARVQDAVRLGLRLHDSERLFDALGRTQARLMFTPEKAARAMEQAVKGPFTTAKELRNELHARLRA